MITSDGRLLSTTWSHMAVFQPSNFTWHHRHLSCCATLASFLFCESAQCIANLRAFALAVLATLKVLLLAHYESHSRSWGLQFNVCSSKNLALSLPQMVAFIIALITVYNYFISLFITHLPLNVMSKMAGPLLALHSCVPDAWCDICRMNGWIYQWTGYKTQILSKSMSSLLSGFLS